MNSFNLRGIRSRSVILHVALAADGATRRAWLTPVRLQGPRIPEPDPERTAVDLLRDLSEQDLASSPFDADGLYDAARPPSSRAVEAVTDPAMQS